MTAARVRIEDLTDADPGSPRYCGHSIGRVIEFSGRWVRVDRIERSGDRVYGVGVCVTPAQAIRIQQRWDIRWGIQCAPNPAPPPDRRAPARPKRFADVDGAAAAIVAAGYRELAKRHHPDAGGDHYSMSLLTQAHGQLRQILAMAKGAV